MKNEIIEFDYNSLIYNVRGSKVMIDSDLANLYGVETKRLKESVRRNLERFPEDFMFILTNEEVRILRSQIASSSLEVPNWLFQKCGKKELTQRDTEAFAPLMLHRVSQRLFSSVFRLRTSDIRLKIIK